MCDPDIETGWRASADLCEVTYGNNFAVEIFAV
jgi:hypothetical protein